MTDAHKLLPCPFCGSHPERTYRTCQTSIAGWRTDQIHCPQCGYDFEDGDEAWNTRSDLIPALLAAERRKALKEAAARLEDTADRTAEAMKLTEQWGYSADVALVHSEKTLRREAAAIRALMEKEQGE